MPIAMSEEQRKRAKELGVEHLIEGFEPDLRDRTWLLSALAQLEVEEEYGLDPSGNSDHADELQRKMREKPDEHKRWIGDRKEFLKKALKGSPPTIDEFLRPSQFEGHHDLLAYDVARSFRNASTLVEDARTAGIDLHNSNDDELFQQLREFHYRKVDAEVRHERESRERWERERESRRQK